MRALLLLSLVPLLVACTQAVADDSAPAALPAAWSGAIAEGTSCVGGSLHLFLEDQGATWTGKVYYESSNLQGAQYRATYRVEGAAEAGMLHLDEAALEEADELPSSYQWCLGAYDFPLDPSGKQPELRGSYTASNGCSCNEATSLLVTETM